MIYIYLEPSALFKAYIPEQGSDNIEYILSKLGVEFTGITSRWTLLEITRGFVKRKNLGELTPKELKEIVAFFLDDINRLLVSRKVKIVDVTKSIIEKSISLILSKNLYAADAIHVQTAVYSGARVMLTDDIHIKRLAKITPLKIISVELTKEEFIRQINTLFS
ncbi:MAG: type II toxin-antitoxin system VapC family toxin [Candidatus Njordarchaeia archaeon]